MDIVSNVKEPVIVAIYYIQLVMSGIFGVLFLFGIFMFIFAFKSPFRRRLAYITTILSPIGILVVIHGPVFVLTYVFDQPLLPNDELGIYVLVPTIESARSGVYESIVRIVKPLLATAFLVGVGILHHASRIPARKRISFGIFLGVPLLWALLETGPSIINLLVS